MTLCVHLLLMCGGPMVHGSSAGRTTPAGNDPSALCRNFVQTVCDGYHDLNLVRYHNWLHAVDVTFTMHRCLRMVKAEHFIGSHERFALMVSALCHDIGHPGLNNAYLVETSHELAMQYNDFSPLESMHSARLFQIAANPSTNIFVNLRPEAYRELRKVCIESILYTDNARHYNLLTDLQMAFESEVDLFDFVANFYDNTPEEYPPSDLIDFYCTPEARNLIRSFFLHFVDLSNTMKPWRLCKFWAERVFEEFFLQGDSEKALGIPVQPLNDRDKVFQPQVQVGFIEYFIVPLASVVVRWMPPLHICEEIALENKTRWLRKAQRHEPGNQQDPYRRPGSPANSTSNPLRHRGSILMMVQWSAPTSRRGSVT